MEQDKKPIIRVKNPTHALLWEMELRLRGVPKPKVIFIIE